MLGSLRSLQSAELTPQRAASLPGERLFFRRRKKVQDRLAQFTRTASFVFWKGVSGGFPRYPTGAIQAIDMLVLSKIVHRVIPVSIDHMLAFLLQSQYAALQTIDIRKFFVVMLDSHLSKYS
jgi:hypothetical protein